MDYRRAQLIRNSIKQSHPEIHVESTVLADGTFILRLMRLGYREKWICYWHIFTPADWYDYEGMLAA